LVFGIAPVCFDFKEAYLIGSISTATCELSLEDAASCMIMERNTCACDEQADSGKNDIVFLENCESNFKLDRAARQIEANLTEEIARLY
jgi:hypothetical protein